MSKHDELLTTNQIAKLHDIPARTVRYWCKTGELAATKIGRDYVVTRSDWRAFWRGKQAERK